MSPAQMGVKAALSLLPFSSGVEFSAERDLENLLANLQGHPGFAEAMGAGVGVLEGARHASALRSRLVRMEGPMMAGVVKDEARRTLRGLDPFGQAGFMKEWPSAERELQ